MMSRTPFLGPHVLGRLGAATRIPPPGAPPSLRALHATTAILGTDKSQNSEGLPDTLGHGSAKGRTGGGEPLDSSSRNAPAQPKISNLSVPGTDTAKDLTKEQRREVDQHNREFDEKHEHCQDAPDDKVDKKYWSGETQGRP